MQCDRCRLVCPWGLSPHWVSYACKIKWAEGGKAFPSAVMKAFPQDPYSYHKVVYALTARSSQLRAWQTVPDEPQPADEVVYVGCVLMKRTDLLRTLLDVLNTIGFSGPVVMGPELCCGRLYQNAGLADLADLYGKRLISALNRLNPREVICWCTICYQRLANYLSSIHPFDFKLKSIPEFLLQKQGRFKFCRPVDSVVTYQDACGLIANEILEPPRGLFRMWHGGFAGKEPNRHSPQVPPWLPRYVAVVKIGSATSLRT